jgi:hypothetical protein
LEVEEEKLSNFDDILKKSLELYKYDLGCKSFVVRVKRS